MILFHSRFLPIGIGIWNCAWGWIFSLFRFQLFEFLRVEVKKRINFIAYKIVFLIIIL